MGNRENTIGIVEILVMLSLVSRRRFKYVESQSQKINNMKAVARRKLRRNT